MCFCALARNGVEDGGEVAVPGTIDDGVNSCAITGELPGYADSVTSAAEVTVHADPPT